MVYYHNNSEWVLGGDLSARLTEFDMEIVKNGIWLPSEVHLIEWLMENDFIFRIIHDNPDMRVTIHCEDAITGAVFSPTVSSLADALACLIIKILKKRERPFDTKGKVYGIIE